MNKTIFLYSTIFSTVIIVAYSLFSANPEKPIAQITASKASYNQKNHAIDTHKTNLEQEVKSLQREVKAIHVTLKQLATKFNSTTPSMTVTAAGEIHQPSQIDLEDMQATEEKIKQAGKERFNEQLLTIEDNFTNESVDKTWAEEKADSVLSAFNSLPAEIQGSIELKVTDCKSSMCRIEVEYEDDIAQNEFEMQLPMLVSEDFPRLSIRYEQHEGVTRGIYFLQSEKI